MMQLGGLLDKVGGAEGLAARHLTRNHKSRSAITL